MIVYNYRDCTILTFQSMLSQFFDRLFAPNLGAEGVIWWLLVM